jgi:alpha-glucosidase
VAFQIDDDPLALPSMPTSEKPRPDDWWQTGVIYQVYPRSFADTDGDGIGDLPGIIAHLDHLGSGPEGLGVDAIWLSPIYPSPWLDGGYDITDHAAIDPSFGSMADFDWLVEAAHERGLKVILDLVLNHTSDLHPWFQASCRGRTDPMANWYIWRDPAGRDARGRPRPPNNWVSYFGGSAWTWDRRRGQYYLHTFLPEQPEVNWREPAVQAAQLEMMRGWLDRGVDGFRLDVLNKMLKSDAFESNPVQRAQTRRPWDRQRHLYDKDQPDLAPLLRVFQSVVDEQPGRMSVGELFEGTVPLAAELTRPRHLVFDFSLLEATWSADDFRRTIERREALFGPDRWPTVVLSNHDRPRHVSRYLEALGRDDPETTDRVARAAAVALLTDRGTAFLYYGDEIGLPNVEVPAAEIQDPPARRASPEFPWWNRDGCRSPMPWTADWAGGFTTGLPWIRLIPDAATRNVERQLRDENSVLAAYRRLIAVRHGSAALSRGSLALQPATPDVLAFVREADGERVLVAINFALGPRTLPLPAGRWTPLFDTDAVAVDHESATGPLMLAGLQAVLLRAAA